MQLPTELRKPTKVNPSVLTIYAAEKAGKSSIVAGLTRTFPKSLVLSTEHGGYDYLEARVLETLTFREFRDALREIEKANTEAGEFIYDYLIVDTITQVDEWSEIKGTLDYMNSIQGRSFNLIDSKDPKKGYYQPGDDNFQSVHTVGTGFGYKWSRSVMMDVFDRLKKLAPYIILIGHTKDKYTQESLGSTVTATQLDLTGKVSRIYARKSDAIAVLKRKKDEAYLSFKRASMDTQAGSRAAHLEDEILISKKLDDDTIETYWNNIYLTT